MPDRRRHGAHEDRGAGGAREEARPVAARPAGRLAAALCADRRESAVAAEPARPCAGRGGAVAKRSRDSRRGARLPAWRRDIFRDRRSRSARRTAARSCSSPTPSTAISSARIFDAAVEVLVAGRLSRACRAAPAARAAALLRPHVPLGRRASTRRARRRERALAALVAVRRARRADGRPGAELPVLASATKSRRCSRTTRDARAPNGRERASCSRNSSPRDGRRPAHAAAAADRREGAAARPLPPEGVRRPRRDRAAAQAHSRP